MFIVVSKSADFNRLSHCCTACAWITMTFGGVCLFHNSRQRRLGRCRAAAQNAMHTVLTDGWKNLTNCHLGQNTPHRGTNENSLCLGRRRASDSIPTAFYQDVPIEYTQTFKFTLTHISTASGSFLHRFWVRWPPFSSGTEWLKSKLGSKMKITISPSRTMTWSRDSPWLGCPHAERRMSK